MSYQSENEYKKAEKYAAETAVIYASAVIITSQHRFFLNNSV